MIRFDEIQQQNKRKKNAKINNSTGNNKTMIMKWLYKQISRLEP